MGADDAPVAVQNGLRTGGPDSDRSMEADSRGRDWLDRLFGGQILFPGVQPISLPTGDRTAAEHDALSRAAACQDLFVVQADPGAGERFIADLARVTSERVLVLTPHSAAADRIVDRVVRYGAPVLRALADDENPIRPSQAVSRVTSAALGTTCVERARREAAAAVTAAEKRLDAFAVVAKAIARLNEVKADLQKLDADAASYAAVLDQGEIDTRSETDTPFALSLSRLQLEHETATARLTAELQSTSVTHTEKATTLARLKEQLAEAARKPGFFGRLFAGKQKPPCPDSNETEKQAHALEMEIGVLAGCISELQKKLDSASAALQSERAALLAAEISARRTAAEAALNAILATRLRTQAEAAALNKVIAAAVPGDDHATAERHLAAARNRVAEVSRTAREAVARAIAEPRIVVGTPRSLGTDPVFSTMAAEPPFGFLVLDRAEQLPETELVGDAHPPDPRPPTNGSAPRGVRTGRPGELPFVARLAMLLDREMWAAEGSRLVCRLMFLSPEERRRVSHEPLADRPEIELRFTASDGEPLLAEIAFPGTTPIAQAKQFLFGSLGEILLRPCGDVVWTIERDSIIATWPVADSDRDAVWIELEPGVREKVSGTGLFAFTAALRFASDDGWDKDRAAAWLGKHLPPLSTGRFAPLPATAGARSA
jgi:hypothetical protein